MSAESSFQWTDRTVLVTGGAGFVGSYLVEDLVGRGARVRVVDDLSTGATANLENVQDDVEIVHADLRNPDVAPAVVRGADVVMHLAARAYGMLMSGSRHDRVLHNKFLMGFHVLQACQAHEVERALMVSSSCIYDDSAPTPTPELPVHINMPESVNEGYGWSKRILEIQSRYVFDRFQLPIAIVRPFNAYGGRYRWNGEASHVVPSLVKKVSMKIDPWWCGALDGDFSDLLHAKDFAIGFRLATELAADCEPINLAGGITVRLVDLVQQVAELAGLDVDIAFDLSKAGRRRKEADLTRLRGKLPDFEPTVPLREGLLDMIEWYRRNRSRGTFAAAR